MQDWQSMDTAPKGRVTEDAGIRGSSAWFEVRVAEKYKAANPGTFIVRRRAWPQGDSWEDRDETYYAPDFFDAWRSVGSAHAS